MIPIPTRQLRTSRLLTGGFAHLLSSLVFIVQVLLIASDLVSDIEGRSRSCICPFFHDNDSESVVWEVWGPEILSGLAVRQKNYFSNDTKTLLDFLIFILSQSTA